MVLPGSIRYAELKPRPCGPDSGLLGTFSHAVQRAGHRGCSIDTDDSLTAADMSASRPAAPLFLLVIGIRALVVFASVLGCLAIFASASPVFAQGTVRGTFGDWELRCDQPPQAPVAPGQPQPSATPPREQCILYQNIADEKDDALSLRISVSKVFDPKTPGVRRPVLLVVARLGVLLPRGLALRIDQTEIGSTGFVRCIPEGCVAQVDMDDALLDKFRKGTTATFIIALTPEEQRGLPLALAGFDKGYEALQ